MGLCSGINETNRTSDEYGMYQPFRNTTLGGGGPKASNIGYGQRYRSIAHLEEVQTKCDELVCSMQTSGTT